MAIVNPSPRATSGSDDPHPFAAPARRSRATLALLLLAGCAAPHRIAHDQPSPLLDPPLDRVVRIFAAKSREAIDLDALLDRLSRFDVVFVGETHLDETTHRLELALYEGLLERRSVVLALEMFERDVQPAIDAYLAGGDEPAFLRSARPWRLMERARREGLPDSPLAGQGGWGSPGGAGASRDPREEGGGQERSVYAIPLGHLTCPRESFCRRQR